MAILPRFPPRGEDELLFPFLRSAFIFPLIFYLSRARARFFDRANLFNGELLFQEELLFGEKRAARGIRGGGGRLTEMQGVFSCNGDQEERCGGRSMYAIFFIECSISNDPLTGT